MIKGVNHQIIEIHKTDNPYFERALLFVSSSFADRSQESLQREGERFVNEANSFSGLRSARAMRWFRRTVLVLVGGFCGMLAGLWLSGGGM